MGKFKVGDKVRVLDGSKIKDYTGGWCDSLKPYTGLNYTVIDVLDFADGRVGYKLQGAGFFAFDERSLKRAEQETIVIYRKDNEVIALDKATGKKAIAKCSPEDTFDFNIGAKLAFDRLVNSNKESITVEDMRKRLISYCGIRTCKGCKLIFPVCRCGCGVSFNSKTPTGKYEMSDEEIKDAFNTAFSNGIKEIKRRAKKGEYVKIVDAECSCGNYKNGDILKVICDDDGPVWYGENIGEFLLDKEYVVLEGYKPSKEDNPKGPHKFKVGDIVKGNLESDDRYNVTNSNMTMGKITEVSEDGKLIDVEILEHKHGDDGEFHNLESKYFDLVEKPKLYNGKIIFTKGDGMFKTGHIYEVNDGRIFTPTYGSLPFKEPLKDIEDVKDYFTGNLDGNRKRENGWSAYTLELMEVKED